MPSVTTPICTVAAYVFLLCTTDDILRAIPPTPGVEASESWVLRPCSCFVRILYFAKPGYSHFCSPRFREKWGLGSSNRWRPHSLLPTESSRSPRDLCWVSSAH